MKAGLEDVIAGESSICYIDGIKGILAYRGYNIHELAPNATFEEVSYLLWFGKLPNAAELKDTTEKMAANRALPAGVIDLMKSMPHKALPMEILRTATSACSMYDPEAEDMSREANVRKAIRLTAQCASLVTAWDRIRNNKPVLEPRKDLSHAGNFSYMLTGNEPNDTIVKALGHLPDSSRRSRIERVHICRTRHRGHAFGYLLGRDLGHRCFEGTASWRRQ